MIIEFKEKYRWLSNFADVEVVWEGVQYKSVEHAYQSVKSTDIEWKDFCASDVTSGQVKRASRKIEIRADWEDIKVDVMNGLLQQKFDDAYYKDKLISTGRLHIIEGNKWGDIFWGVDLKTGEGRNVLGSLIMDIRDTLKNDR